MPIRQILCAVRGGPESRETVRRAISEALDSGARLTFFHIMDAEFLGYATHSTLRVVYRELREMGKFVMLILCDRARARARARGVAEVDYVLRDGDVQTQLSRMAIETGAELMVVGKPTRSPTRNVFKAGDFDSFVAGMEKEGRIRIIQVVPETLAGKDLQGGLVL